MSPDLRPMDSSDRTRGRRLDCRGYTLVEMLVVLAVISATLGLGLSSSQSGRHLQQLNGDYRRLADLINEARFGALNGSSSWLVTVDCVGGRIAVGPDDGWRGTLSGEPGQVLRRDYHPGSPDFDEARRGDGRLDGPERLGSFSLSRAVHIVHAPDSGYACPASVGFGAEAATGGLTVLWVADRAFEPLVPRAQQPGLVRPLVILPSGAVVLPGVQ